MNKSHIQNALERYLFTSSLEIVKTPEGYVFGAGKTVGNGIEGWAPGALFIHTDGTGVTAQYRNVGTVTTASWKSLHNIPAGEYITYDALAYNTYAASAFNKYLDNALATFGNDGDVCLRWNATYLEAGPLVSTTGNFNTAPLMGCLPNTASCYEVFDDFLGDAFTNRWTVTEDDAACTQAYTANPGGTVLLTNKATTDNNAQQIVYDRGGAAYEPFKLAATKNLWYEARVKCAAGATEVDVVMGLINHGEDLTGVADNLAQDGVVIHKDDGATTVKCTASKDGANTSTNANIGTMTTGWHTYGFYVNGVTSITPYFDGTADTALASTTIPDDEALTPFFLVRNGDAITTQTLEIDYVRCVQLR